MTGCVNVVWALLSALAFPAFLSDDTLSFSNSIFSVCFFSAVYVVLWKNSKNPKDRRLCIYTHVLGALFSFMIAAGRSLDVYGSVHLKSILVGVVLFTHVIGDVLSLFWRSLIGAEQKLKRWKQRGGVFGAIEKAMTWLIRHPYVIAIILLLCWLPLFVADYPGGFRYDATKELNQATEGFNGNFPLLHSVIVTRLLPAVYRLTGSYNAGVALYVIAQMVMIACMYTHILCVFGRKGVNRVLLLGILLYCGCFPVIQILVEQEVRDVLFSALLMYATFLFYCMVSDEDAFFSGIGKPAALGLVFVLALLARNNNAGPVMWLAVVAVSAVVWAVYRKAHLRGVTVFFVTSIAGYWLLGTLLTALCQPLTPAGAGASLSVISQPIARAYVYEREEWTEEEVEELGKYMDLDGMEYCAENADPTKNRLRNGGSVMGFVKLWCKIGLEHPGCYLDAILANTQNMWYPDSVVDGYNQHFRKEGQPYYGYDKCYYSIRGELGEPAEHMNLWPAMLNYYTRIGLYISFEKIPVISMLFSIGFQFWAILNCLFYVLYRRIKKLVLPLTIMLGYMLVSAFVPLVLLRYFAAAFLAAPMVIVFTLQPDHGC